MHLNLARGSVRFDAPDLCARRLPILLQLGAQLGAVNSGARAAAAQTSDPSSLPAAADPARAPKSGVHSMSIFLCIICKMKKALPRMGSPRNN